MNRGVIYGLAIALYLSVLPMPAAAEQPADEQPFKVPDGYAEAGVEGGRVSILPEVPTFVELSSTDVNRFVCDGDIEDVRYSTEKGLAEPSVLGKELFIKYAVTDTGGVIAYLKTPVELYVKCGGSRYTIITLPRKMLPRPVYLTSGVTGRAKENARLFKGKAIEEKVAAMVYAAYNNEYPPSWSVKDYKPELAVKRFAGLEVSLARKVQVEGEGLDMYEYNLALKVNVKELILDEDDFASKLDGAPGRVAAAITRLHLVNRQGCKACMTARAFIIRRSSGGAR